MRALEDFVCGGVRLLALPVLVLSNPALAETASATGGAGTVEADIIVTARRSDERIQDVPLTVNAVGSETIEKLNFRDFKDIAAVVPGLTFNVGNRTSGSVTTLRGLNVDTTSSGNNGTVEFYLNDAPISGGVLLQSMYDVAQIEVLRGPQGTLRGRASPSGSITVTTRRPVGEWGGYAQGTITGNGGVNVNGAINAPIIKDVLALRVAGLVDDNEGSRVHSVNNPNLDSSGRTRALRVSLRLTPATNIDINASYGHLVKNAIVWDQVESAELANPALPASPRVITAQQRLAVENVPNANHQAFDIFNWQAQWSLLGQRLNYVGSYTKQDLQSSQPSDAGDFFNGTYPGDASLSNNNFTYASLASTLNLQNIAATSHTYSRQENHEIRLSSDERVLGAFDYVIGGLINKLQPFSDGASVRSANFSGGVVSPTTFTGFTPSFIVRRGRIIERAVFGNLRFHLGEQTEISGGLRHLNYQENLNGANNSYSATIWNASVKHRFNDDLMVYTTAGSSFRVGSGSNGLILTRSININTLVDPFLATLLPTTPERSKSYEIGLRSTWFDKKLLLNISAFHQDFKGYIFPVSPFYVVDNTGTVAAPVYGNPVLTIASIAAPVPVKVNGVEAELALKPWPNFNLSATFAYAKAKMTNATIPCTPAGASSPPTTAQIHTGGTQQVGQCRVSQLAGRSSPFNSSVQADYTRPINGELSGFVRGLASIFGSSKNDPQNPYDDISAYALVNLYAGVRSNDGRWEISAYAKNIFDTFRVTDRSANPAVVTTSLGTKLSNYRMISTTDPREFGLTARFAFGSR